MKNILFITGKLAEKGLRTVIESIENKDFTYEIRNLNVNVAALLTTDMIERRIGNIDSFDEIIIPGRVRGDLESCLLYTSPSPRDLDLSRMPSSA